MRLSVRVFMSKQKCSTPDAAAMLREVHKRLWEKYGPQHWWPAKSPTEVVIGAILTQNTAWTNVERAIENLRAAGCLCFHALHMMSQDEIAELVRPSGTFRVKAARLKAFVEVLWSDHSGSLDSLLGGDLRTARARLLAIHGIGPETADAMLLYAANRPSFVVDTYTMRILRRHRLIDLACGYEDVRELFMQSFDAEPQLFNEYHALLVRLGKEHCRVKAECRGCPLADLPHDETIP